MLTTYSLESLQDLILATADLDKLMRLPKEEALRDLHLGGFVYFTLSKKELNKLYAGLPTFNNVEISEARLHVSINSSGQPQESSIYLKFVTGNHILIPLDVLQLSKIDSLFKKEGKYYPLNSRVHKVAHDWKQNSMSEYYDKDTYEHYEFLHNQIKDALVRLITKNTMPALNIIDGGCGTGNFLKKISTELTKDILQETKTETLTTQIHLFGFDFNEANVQSCREQFKEEKGIPCRFEVGDLTKTNEVIKNFRQHNSETPNGDVILDKESKTALILSGSLTRLVLTNGFEALKALQSIMIIGQVDFIIGGGVGEPLINHYIAKQLGFKLVSLIPGEQHTFPKEKNKDIKFFAFERMSQEELLQIKMKKMVKRNVLNLSLSATPELILEALLKKIEAGQLVINNGLLINLSFARINDEVLVQLKKFMNKCPNSSLLIQHNDQKCIDMLMQDSELRSRFLKPPQLIFNDIDMTSSKNTLSSGAVEMVQLLLTKGDDPIAIITKAINAGNREILQFFIDLELQNNPQFPKVDWNKQDSNGNTLVHLCAHHGIDPSIFSKITTINLNTCNALGQTALYIFQQKQSPAYLLLMRMYSLFGEELNEVKEELKSLIRQGIDLIAVANITQDEETIDFAKAIVKEFASSEQLTGSVSKSGKFATVRHSESKHCQEHDSPQKNPTTKPGPHFRRSGIG